MIGVETRVEIERPIGEVFDYVSDPRNLSAWNSAVRSVQPLGATTYLMERDLPGGAAANEIEVIARVPQREFTFRTTSGPTPFAYRIRFTAIEHATVMEVDVSASLGPVGDLLGSLARGMVKRGVDENLASLKTLLERAPVAR
jgi:uncharacterized protein YndB with AHSA1/START domain